MSSSRVALLPAQEVSGLRLDAALSKFDRTVGACLCL